MKSILLEAKHAEQPAQEAQSATQYPPDGPAMLPAHILAVGDQYQLAGSTWWMGRARPAYEEVAHLQGVVLYNRTTHIFLTGEEATEAQRLLLVLNSEK